jgi:hypothetical protein
MSREYKVDLSVQTPPEQTLEEVFKACRERIGRAFATSLPSVVSGYVDLATSQEVDPDVRRKAADRILDTFLPTAGKIQTAPGTTIQILNSMPLPEMMVTDGKESKAIDVMGKKYVLPVQTKRKIGPSAPDENKRREHFLGPKHAMGSASPAPDESPTPLKPKL